MPPGVRSDYSDAGTPTSVSVSAPQGRAISPLSALADDESFFMSGGTNNKSVRESATSYNEGGNGEGSVKGNQSGALKRWNKNAPILRAGVGFEVVKIGHTSLHNPGGRSSWIGL